MLLPFLRRLGQAIASCVAVPVATVRAGDEIVITQNRDGAHGHRLFAGVEV
jgi:hypothetical protein